MAVPMAALDTHLREQNRELLEPVRSPKQWAPMAPMPGDPAVCRWCGGRLRALVDGEPADYCQNGCAKNSDHPYLGHCSECGRNFETGRPLMQASLCSACEPRLVAEQPNEGRTRHRTYHYSEYGRGSYRD